MRLRFATTSGVGGATGAGAAGGSEDDDVLTVLSVDEGDDDIKGLHTLRAVAGGKTILRSRYPTDRVR